MVEYPIVAIIWEDHVTRFSSEIPENADDVIGSPTLTVGILLTETDKSYLVAHDIERHEDRDDATYTVIIKNAVLSIKKFGDLSLDQIRFV